MCQTRVTNIITAFFDASKFNADLSQWDTVRVKNMNQGMATSFFILRVHVQVLMYPNHFCKLFL